jgi:transposase-like protein
VITGVERRRRYSGDERLWIVAETYEPGAKVSEVVAQHGIARSLIQHWRESLMEKTLPGAETARACRALPAASAAPMPAFVRIALESRSSSPVEPERGGTSSCARLVLGGVVLLRPT